VEEGVVEVKKDNNNDKNKNEDNNYNNYNNCKKDISSLESESFFNSSKIKTYTSDDHDILFPSTSSATKITIKNKSGDDNNSNNINTRETIPSRMKFFSLNKDIKLLSTSI